MKSIILKRGICHPAHHPKQSVLLEACRAPEAVAISHLCLRKVPAYDS